MFLNRLQIKPRQVLLLAFVALATMRVAAAVEVISGATKTFTVEPRAGSTYRWQIDGGLPLASTTNTLTYTWSGYTPGQDYELTVIETDINNCRDQQKLTISIIAPPDLELDKVLNDICNGQSLDVAVLNIPGATYQWKLDGVVVPGATGNTLSIPNVPLGNHTLDVIYILPSYTSDPNPQSFTVWAVPTVQLAVAKASVCQGTDMVFTATSDVPSVTYYWTVQGNNDPETTNVLRYNTDDIASGTVKATVQAANSYAFNIGGCPSNAANAQAIVMASPAPKTVSYEECATQGTLQVNSLVSAQGRKVWYATETSSTPITIAPINTNEPQSHTYYVASVTTQGCESKREPVSINIYENPIFVTESQEGAVATIRMEQGTPPYVYTMRDEESGPYFSSIIEIEGMKVGKNSIIISDAQGCKVSATIDAKINLIPDEYFSPNNDGWNDLWLIKNIESYPNTTIIIRDRYGKELARYKGIDFKGWDGKYQGNPVISDDYWYEIQAHEIGARLIGHFNLRR
jgi:gliding motility-associated-like protein